MVTAEYGMSQQLEEHGADVVRPMADLEGYCNFDDVAEECMNRNAHEPWKEVPAIITGWGSIISDDDTIYLVPSPSSNSTKAIINLRDGGGGQGYFRIFCKVSQYHFAYGGPAIIDDAALI